MRLVTTKNTMTDKLTIRQVIGPTLLKFSITHLARSRMSVCFFFFSSRRRHTRCSRDWSSDVCSSDLLAADLTHVAAASKVRIEIDADRIPRFEGVTPVEAAGAGEEYEIVVTAPNIDTDRKSVV